MAISKLGRLSWGMGVLLCAFFMTHVEATAASVDPANEFGVLTDAPTSRLYSFDFDGRFVVWSDNRAGEEIYAYDLQTQTKMQVSTNNANQKWYSCVSDGIVVWIEGTDDKIYARDLLGRYWGGNRYEVTTLQYGTGGQIDIDGSWVVYGDDPGGTAADIFAKNLFTEEVIQITNSPSYEFSAAISGNTVVYSTTPGHAWGWGTNDMDWDVYGFDLDTRQTFAIETGPEHFIAAIEGDLVMLQQIAEYGYAVPGELDLFVHNLASDEVNDMTLVAMNFRSAAISGNFISYEDQATGYLHVYDIRNESTFQASWTPVGQYSGIVGSTVVWQDLRSPAGVDNQFIYGNTIVPEPGTLALIAPAVLGFAGIAFRKMRKGF